MNADREAALFFAHRSRPSRETLAELLKLHQNRIYNICYQVLTHPEDAEDASQEVLIEASRCVIQLADPRAFRVWLYRVALSTSLNIRRTRSRRTELARRLPVFSGAPDMDREERDAFMQAISDLDDQTRSLLLSHYFEGATLKELGRQEGVSPVAVWKRLERAKERLRLALAGAGFSVAATGVAHSLESITPVAAPSLLITESLLIKALATVAGGGAVGSKIGLTGGTIVAAFLIAGIAGTGGYFVGRTQARTEVDFAVQHRLSAPQSTAGISISSITSEAKSKDSFPSTKSTDDKGRSKLEVLGLLRSMNGKWLRGSSVAWQLLSLDPEVVLEALGESWQSLATSDRILLMKAFEEEGFEYLIGVFDLGMRDSDKLVRSAATRHLRAYAFAEFSAEGGYETWKKSVEGKSLQEVRAESARRYVRKMEEMTPDEARSATRALAAYLTPLGRDALLQAGLLPILERWLANHPSADARDTLRLMDQMPLDEAFLRRVVMPWMDSQTQDGRKARGTAMLLLGKPGNTWAIDVLLPYMEPRDRSSAVFVGHAALALAEIGDYRVIPAMIDAINRDNTYDTVYGIGHFGLGKLTGVQYDPSHDGSWWTEWWKNNQSRFLAK